MKQQYILTNFKPLFGAETVIEAIAVSGQRIEALGTLDELSESGYSHIDLQGLTVSPGFIDLQLNGCGGVNFLRDDISIQTLDSMHETNLKSGCTAFLPTLITSTDEDMKKAVDVVAAYQQLYPGRIPGVHLEGPYLNPARKGIHDKNLIRRPSATMVDYLCDHADTIRMITLAPEMCSIATIERLALAGIIVSLGHTNATCEQAKLAEQAGARFATHLHNAMSPLTSREPGVVGAIFDSQQLGAGIIADGYHLSWENLRIAHHLMQDRLILVTDATAAAGSDISEFDFGGQTVYHNNGKCTGADGTLGGSALTMIEAVANSINHGIDPQDCIRMATINAARTIGVENEMGQMVSGQYANLAIFDDQFAMHGSVSGGVLKLL